MADITVAIGLACSLVGAFVGISGYRLNENRKNTEDGANKGVIFTELGYIKAGIDDIKREQCNQMERHNQLAERVTRVEESAKQAHLRLNRYDADLAH